VIGSKQTNRFKGGHVFKAIINFFINLFKKKDTAVENEPAPSQTDTVVQVESKIPPTTPIQELPRQTIKGTLRFGMSGEDVKKLQHALLLTGHFEGEPLGNFKELTLAAVKAFQQDMGLEDEGIVGAMTAAKLNFVFEVSPVTENEQLTLAEVFKLKEGSLEWYEAAYKVLKYDPGFEVKIQNVAKRIQRDMPRYMAVSQKVNVPWHFIAALHNMESGGSFSGILHNGERIIGTGRKKTLVPKGRGPFGTWEHAAIDILTLKGLHKHTSWTLPEILYRGERYNGTGYITGAGRADTSVYVWSMTNINDNTGKYTSDGKYDPTANSNGQVGLAAIYKELEKMGLVSFAQNTIA